MISALIFAWISPPSSLSGFLYGNTPPTHLPHLHVHSWLLERAQRKAHAHKHTSFSCELIAVWNCSVRFHMFSPSACKCMENPPPPPLRYNSLPCLDSQPLTVNRHLRSIKPKLKHRFSTEVNHQRAAGGVYRRGSVEQLLVRIFWCVWSCMSVSMQVFICTLN